MFWTMAQTEATRQLSPTGRASAKTWAGKVVTLVVMGVVLGFGYDWAAPRFYGPTRPASFFLGMLHGALMPTALPALVIGKDVPIYASGFTGRSYKIGYIAGINLCGVLFFGVAFRSPSKPTA